MKFAIIAVLLTACGATMSATTLASLAAEKECVDQAEAGVGRAALKAEIDECRASARARLDGGAQ